MEIKVKELEELHAQLEEQVARVSELIERLASRIDRLEIKVNKNTEAIAGAAQVIEEKVRDDSQDEEN